MTPDPTSFKTTPRRDRVMATVAALTASAAINSAVLLCFDSSSPAQWLLSTPVVLARLARCEQQQHTRQTQDRCKQQVAATRPAPPTQDLQLAGR